MSQQKQDQKIARLYYIEGYSQSDIAKKLSISVASVSRAITRAKESGVVKITIQESGESYSALEAELEKGYGLNECAITQSFDQDINVYSGFSDVLQEILSRILPKGGLVGVSWGETLKSVGDFLTPQSLQVMQADVVPMIGAMGTVETGIYPNSIARVLADKLGGKAYLVNAPAVSDSPNMNQVLYNSKTFAPVRDLWSSLAVALVGCSGIDKHTSVVRNNIFTVEELEAVQRIGCVSAVNFSFLNSQGMSVSHSIGDRILHVTLDQLKKIPQVVLLAHGASKVPAIKAALASGAVKILITDEKTGLELRNHS